MDDTGVSEVIGGILTVFIVVALVGIIFGNLMHLGDVSSMDGYRTRYAVVDGEAVPALSAPGTWDADSIKIHFVSCNTLYFDYEEGTHSGIEGTRFVLIDPDGGSHELISSVTMTGKTVSQGAELYCFTLSSDISGPYYITNSYARIADESILGGALSYPKSLASGTWRVQIIDDSLGVLIADEVVTI
ncbi:hypothetical protein L1S32_07625 [Methanogenium sp. S4BF]|uniref:hypothetical protein n=1 Tax=Methanogenium sp. S4BF TaxID=1789226 RepID=UPI002416E19F|nr:hypothetical protein [Methanogenium sp. S4BF]WFN33713.1 hypothetical protein L1S32_07625 [Methanogenium sp. S4BF]